ncbi:hypothetical protein Aeqsu_2658 [Aequorivita sublithincola DSM 14238]|uniref:Uncharacterized protein n=1 Tax=Aequorivita sublithincola (strain DSM 14238 / LMG 21431 / ACAM 643 / 9-3) TaxID=746697 RepID=I3YYP3_AEQSU|nr:hypothetical protein [Aequorivita sublithincola]AFL82111.1 hypothetical protein Aeqsu_2658 [Aequorivita sublithincola DSM 14238]
MKTPKIVLLLFLTTLFTTSCSKDSTLTEIEQVEQSQHFNYTIGEGPFVYFDDIVFKELLLNNFDINTNKDNEISFEEATSFNGAIDVSFKNIESLKGIEKFVNITALNCANNNIDKLNFAANTNLEFLSCGNNPFSEINLKPNIKLKNLDIRTTSISTLDLSENINLMSIRGMCNYNLKTVNLKNNNNTKIAVFFFGHSNFSLECVQVDNISYSNSATNWIIPTTAAYSLNCFDEMPG